MDNSWTDFWREHRLGFQLHLAEQNGYVGHLQTLGEKLLDVLPAFFDSYTPQPSLLHGDLWSGNHAFLADGTPVIFDPAPYYGDRECDLAMTELFGRLSRGFSRRLPCRVSTGCGLCGAQGFIQFVPRPQPRQPVWRGICEAG